MSDVKIFAEEIEEEAKAQVEHIASLPAFAESKIRIMPDVHAGKGCVCGFTADLGNKVVPNLIGVDIGCGVLAVKLGKIDIDYAKLDAVIKSEIPYGKRVHGRLSNFVKIGYKLWKCNPDKCIAKFKNGDYPYFKLSIASLGGGNHFIEIDQDADGCKYLLIHTGSRNFGKKVCEFWQQHAIDSLTKPLPDLKQMIKDVKIRCAEEGRVQDMKEEIAKAQAEYKQIVEDSIPKDKDLAYLEGEDRDGYMHDMHIAQRYADLNRKMIMFFICRKMGWDWHDKFTTMHNYIGDDNIIRKSAISAYEGERVCIPMNMRDGTLVCIGKGNPDWNCSAPHGAGRKMSRRKARETLDIDEFKKTMVGIYTTTANIDTIDEAPDAYKDSNSIINQISETVEVSSVIKPTYNFKAAE